MSTNDVYHSITKIPTFITKTGFNLVNDYYDRYSSDQCSLSQGSVESYYLEGYYGSMYDLDTNSSDSPTSPFSPTQKNLGDIHEEGIDINYSSHHSYPRHHQNLSPPKNKKSIYSLSKSPTSSSVYSSSSSINTQNSITNDDQNSNIEIQESDSFIRKIKKLIMKARNNSHFIFDIKTDEDEEEDEEEGIDEVLSSHPLISTLSNHEEYFKHKNKSTNIHILTHPSVYNHTFPFNSNDDLFDVKIVSPCSVRKKDNIYESNPSKYEFLYQKDEFLKTLVCSPNGISPRDTTFTSRFEYFSPQSPLSPTKEATDEKEREKRILKEQTGGEANKNSSLALKEKSNIKDHSLHIHTIHKSRSNYHPHFNHHSQQYHHSSLHEKVHSQDHHDNKITSHLSNTIYNPEFDAKTNLMNIHQTDEARQNNVTSIHKEDSSNSDILLTQIKSPSSSTSNIADDEKETNNKVNSNNTSKKSKLKTKSNYIPIPLNSASIHTSHTSLASTNDSDYTDSSSSEDIKHIQNCSCDKCLHKSLMKTLGEDVNKIPSLTKPLYAKNHQTARSKYNIFDSLYYETVHKNNQGDSDDDDNINNTTNSTPINSIFNDNNSITTTVICKSPKEEKNFRFPSSTHHFLTSSLFGSLSSSNNNKNKNTITTNDNDNKNIEKSNNNKIKNQKSLPSLTTSNITIESGQNHYQQTGPAATTLEKIIDQNDPNRKSLDDNNQKDSCKKEEENSQKEKQTEKMEKEKEENSILKDKNPSSSTSKSVNLTKYYHQIMNNWQLNNLNINSYASNMGMGKPKFDQEDDEDDQN